MKHGGVWLLLVAVAACEAVISFDGLEFGAGGGVGTGGNAAGGTAGDAPSGGGGSSSGIGGMTAGSAGGGSGPGPTTTVSTGTGACDDPGPLDGSCTGLDAECSSCDGSTCNITCPGHAKCNLSAIQCPEGVRCQVNCLGTGCQGKVIFCPSTNDNCVLICNDAGSCTDANLRCFNEAPCVMHCVDPGSCDGSAELTCLNKSCSANCSNGTAGPLIDCANGSCSCTGC